MSRPQAPQSSARLVCAPTLNLIAIVLSNRMLHQILLRNTSVDPYFHLSSHLSPVLSEGYRINIRLTEMIGFPRNVIEIVILEPLHHRDSNLIQEGYCMS